jgi:hypothetical protein
MSWDLAIEWSTAVREALLKVFRISSIKKEYWQPQGICLFVILYPSHQRQMSQEQINILPTALRWDNNGELCSDILKCLIDRLQAQEVKSQNQKAYAFRGRGAASRECSPLRTSPIEE